MEGNACNARYMTLPGTVYYLSNILPYVPQSLFEGKIETYISDSQTKEELKKSSLARRLQTLAHMSHNDHFVMINLATPNEVANGQIICLNSYSNFGQIVAYSLR